MRPVRGQQDLSTYAAEVNDPVRVCLNVKVSAGSAKIVKTSEDGNVSGISFTITGNGVNQTVRPVAMVKSPSTIWHPALIP